MNAESRRMISMESDDEKLTTVSRSAFSRTMRLRGCSESSAAVGMLVGAVVSDCAVAEGAAMLSGITESMVRLSDADATDAVSSGSSPSRLMARQSEGKNSRAMIYSRDVLNVRT